MLTAAPENGPKLGSFMLQSYSHFTNKMLPHQGIGRETTVLLCYGLLYWDIYCHPITIKSDNKPGISKQEIKGSPEKMEKMKLMKTVQTVSVSQEQPSRWRDYRNIGIKDMSTLSLSLPFWNVNENCWNCWTNIDINRLIDWLIDRFRVSLLMLTSFVEHRINIILNGDPCLSLGFLFSYWRFFFSIVTICIQFLFCKKRK